MNDTPTSGPIAASITHHARDAISSRHSFASSQLSERKKDLFESTTARRSPFQFFERSLAPDAPAAEQDEPVAHALRIGNLVDRQKQRAAGGRVGAQDSS